jgi:hypothetical protein
MQTRALISAFDDYLKRALEVDIHTHIPPRVLPVSTKRSDAGRGRIILQGIFSLSISKAYAPYRPRE